MHITFFLYANNKSFAPKRFVICHQNTYFKTMLKQVFQQPNAHSSSCWFSICQIEKSPITERYHPFVLQRHNYHSDKYLPLRDQKKISTERYNSPVRRRNKSYKEWNLRKEWNYLISQNTIIGKINNLINDIIKVVINISTEKSAKF